MRGKSEMILYHGSDHIIEKPLFGKGRRYNDYGMGFYCAKSKALAAEWAAQEDKDGIVNKYAIDASGLKTLNLNETEYPILSWLSVLLENRVFDDYSQLRIEAKRKLKDMFSVDYNSCDLIVGYRADDSYFTFAKNFLDGLIPYRTLVHAMFLGNLGNQYVLKSRKAFDSIEFKKSFAVKSAVYYPKKKEREIAARENYKKSRKSRFQDDDILISDIIRGRLTENEWEILRRRVPSGGPRKLRGDA